eukprot:CAMPEP_0184687438 /NCGR_PEP_ID=MMETSP0312-20130426/26340_1 /TAXON_ID=31354 /ORGANISM="Compsopogon coeruleus, Strain SAG 36.94" /LENGTH=401 /DNA_ID=CAMNT_0027143565 /DNA_START=578 /DNA_END=1783 /DNA_ORIENTATION=+
MMSMTDKIVIKRSASKKYMRIPDPLFLEGRVRRKTRLLNVWKEFEFRLQDSTVYLLSTARGEERDKGSVSLLDGEVWTEPSLCSIFVRTKNHILLEFLPTNQEEAQKWGDTLATATERRIEDSYSLGGFLGSGNFSEVVIGYDQHRQAVAVKIMQKKKADQELLDSVKREIQFLRLRLAHPRIVQTVDVFDQKDNIYIVMECVSGGTLLNATESKCLTENDCKLVMFSVLEALVYLHEHDVVHRDLKLENVLLQDQADLSSVKVADFGLSEIVKPNRKGVKVTSGMYGTPYYAAPEIARNEQYTTAVDIWSSGVLLYRLISSEFPFDGRDVMEVMHKIKDGVVIFPDHRWTGISKQAKNLIRSMLEMNPTKRITAAGARGHDWFSTMEVAPPPKCENSVLL